MSDPTALFFNTCRQVARQGYRWLWDEPSQARGPLWTVCMWVAVIAAAHVLVVATLPMLVFLLATWGMRRVGAPKNPARPHFRRRR